MANNSICYYDEKSNTVMLRSDYILPNTSGMSWKEHSKAFSDAFAMTYQERIEKYADTATKVIMMDEILAHPGCKISEFTYA